MLNSLIQLFLRDLDKLKAELELYNNEPDLWITSGQISNSAGNLALHLCGNLNHFIGATLGHTEYVRDRPAEFSSTNIPVLNIIKEIENTKKMVSTALTPLSDDDLQCTYPVEVFGEPMTTEFFLLHLSTHLNYHLGQINYHRRLVK